MKEFVILSLLFVGLILIAGCTTQAQECPESVYNESTCAQFITQCPTCPACNCQNCTQMFPREGYVKISSDKLDNAVLLSGYPNETVIPENTTSQTEYRFALELPTCNINSVPSLSYEIYEKEGIKRIKFDYISYNNYVVGRDYSCCQECVINDIDNSCRRGDSSFIQNCGCKVTSSSSSCIVDLNNCSSVKCEKLNGSIKCISSTPSDCNCGSEIMWNTRCEPKTETGYFTIVAEPGIQVVDGYMFVGIA